MEDVITEIDSLLSHLSDFNACEYAKTLADDINNGIGIVLCESPLDQTPPKPVKQLPVPAVPNPFKNSTTIRWVLASAGRVELSVYDRTGRLVRTLVDGEQSRGPRYAEWNGLNERGEPVSQGIYFSVLRVGSSVRSGRLVLLR